MGPSPVLLAILSNPKSVLARANSSWDHSRIDHFDCAALTCKTPLIFPKTILGARRALQAVPQLMLSFGIACFWLESVRMNFPEIWLNPDSRLVPKIAFFTFVGCPLLKMPIPIETRFCARCWPWCARLVQTRVFYSLITVHTHIRSHVGPTFCHLRHVGHVSIDIRDRSQLDHDVSAWLQPQVLEG